MIHAFRPATILRLSLPIAVAIASVETPPVAAQDSSPSPSPLPAAWLAAWEKPAMSDRPLQIVHGIDPRRAGAADGNQSAEKPDGSNGFKQPRMAYYADLGLGGIVCNVSFQDYLQSDEHWQTLIAGVEACRESGLTVWLYDEEGYPSGAAGGLVLKTSRDFEAMELAYDASREDPFALRPAYEHTHASNNYYAARRYVNLIDDRAVGCFLRRRTRRMGSGCSLTLATRFRPCSPTSRR